MSEKDYQEAREFLLEQWGDSATRVIEICNTINRFDGDTGEFLKYCSACGGNWGGMLLTGIRDLYPTLYDAIPDDMGVFAFACIIRVLQLCGVDTSR